MQPTTNQTVEAVDAVLPENHTDSTVNNTTNAELEAEQSTSSSPSISYDEVMTKIMLRHPRAQIDQALATAIEQEQQAYEAAHHAWQLQVTAIEVQRQAALEHNAGLTPDSSDVPMPVPELPVEPTLQLAKRRQCYRTEVVDVDLELTTQTQPAKREYDDQAFVTYEYPATEAHSDAQIAKVKRERFKQARNQLLAAQTVVVDELTFDADELSQQRMARALLVMDEQQTIPWILANNDVAEITKTQLFSACKLAAEQQTALWIGE
ncbi:DUF4376 domain-containing protein [Pseudoalteromonas sp. T1lg65]|uniref:DUF4376 domain-containing protein n=1 Tax=Pseudoalteromonas sp. T1lg65 TaxID=2077101 RepID=UPI003F78CA2F